MKEAYRLYSCGRYAEALEIHESELRVNPDDAGAVIGMARILMATQRYKEALPWLEKADQQSRAEVPDNPGEQLKIACAHWCLGARDRAIEIVRDLCVGITNHTINGAPDSAGGATFGLILHYLSVTADDPSALNHAFAFLRALSKKYDKRPAFYPYPAQTVQQVLGKLSLREVLTESFGDDSIEAVKRSVAERTVRRSHFADALFQDGAIARQHGNASLFFTRMREVLALGYHSGGTRWSYAAHELERA